MQHPSFDTFLEKWWNVEVDGTTLFRIVVKLKNVKKKVREWNKSLFGNIFEAKSTLKDNLTSIQNRIQHEGYSMDLVKEENF